VETERERKRGGGGAGHGVEQRDGVAAAQPRHARAVCCRTTVEGARVGVTRTAWLTGGLGCDGGPGRQRLGAALTGGVGSTVRPIRFSNRIKFISNGFKFAPNFDR
jgi:hypothetical protein